MLSPRGVNSNTAAATEQPAGDNSSKDEPIVNAMNVDDNESSEFALYQLYKRNFDQDTLDDLSLLKEPTDETVTRILKNRYNNSRQETNGGSMQFYTYLGPTIIAVNPYQKTKNYKNPVKT